MTVEQLDPIYDPRWNALLLRHAKASVFHTPAWLRTLRDAYGYESVALTTSMPGEPLSDGLVASRVDSWLTGSRLVSLPFADHCDPLVDSPSVLAALVGGLRERFQSRTWKYIELRPIDPLETSPFPASELSPSATFFLHLLDLHPSTEDLYRGFHKSCIQRKLQRAEREGLVIERGHDEDILARFYRLFLLTRRRHQLPPQPLDWFRLLIRNFGEDLVIWIASKDDRPIAAILTLAWRDMVVYKYGCSDADFHQLGGMPVLYWQAIQYAKVRNAVRFDLGRSDLDNPGLVTFKNHWGARCTTLNYYRDVGASASAVSRSRGGTLARHLLSLLPDSCVTATGRILYRHMG
ncbi:MAG: GNAT family N-acetyltransferase [Terracidiphilus sp.]|jgi:hypothetical protein